MLLYYLKIFFRNIFKQVSFTILNIGGLAVGIASSFIILIYVIQETSYEKHFPDHERTYRVSTKFMTMGEFANGPEVFLEVAPDVLPWIEATCRVDATELEISNGSFDLTEWGLEVEQNFFDMFPYKFKLGDPKTAMARENSIVLSEVTAKKIFGEDNPLGRILEVGDNSTAVEVTGVVDLDGIRSHLNAPFWVSEIVGSDNTAQTTGFNDNWLSVSNYNYIRVPKGTSRAEIQAGLDKLVQDYVFPGFESTLSFEDWFVRDDSYRLILQPIDDIYLKGTLRFDLSEGGNEATVKTLLVIAFLIIFIAAVNFINLTTARATNRAKEVGIKKTMGTSKQSLALQFLSESILFSLMAVILAFGLAELGLILFESITGQALLDTPLLSFFNVVLVIMLAALVGIFAGIYPAFYISSFNPSAVLKGEFFSIKNNTLFRNVLVIFQFTLSIILIISSITMFRQLNFIRNMDMGFDRNDVLIIDNTNILGDNLNVFKNAIAERSEVQRITIGNRYPGSTSSFSITSLVSENMEESVKVNRFRGDYDFIEALGFDLIKGRGFSADIASDSNAVILNQAAVKALELEDPVGAILNDEFTVIGVVRDFNYESVRTAINPVVITLGTGWPRIAIKVNVNQAASLISFLDSEWKSYVPEEPLRYHFLDENFANLMKNDTRMTQVVSIFTVLAILISCLGLFGLSAFVANQRKKEIGIRKIHGASVINVLMMLNFNFLKLIGFALIVAIPVSIYVVGLWLSEFVYRINITTGIFLLAGVITISIAIASVSFQSLTAARMNPVNTLKDE